MRVARDTLRGITVKLPAATLKRIDSEMRRDRRWLFATRSRAIRALLDEALSAREMARSSAAEAARAQKSKSAEGAVDG